MLERFVFDNIRRFVCVSCFWQGLGNRSWRLRSSGIVFWSYQFSRNNNDWRTSWWTQTNQRLYSWSFRPSHRIFSWDGSGDVWRSKIGFAGRTCGLSWNEEPHQGDLLSKRVHDPGRFCCVPVILETSTLLGEEEWVTGNGYRFFKENLEEKRDIRESLIKPENNSTNLIYRFVDTTLPPCRYWT